MPGSLDIQTLLPWIEQSLASNSNLLAQGYQGQTLLYSDGKQKIVIKTPHGKGLIRRFHIHMLRHEHAAYERLHGVTGIPECYGMVADTYLALEYIDAHTMRQQRPENDSKFYDKLFDVVKQMHERKISHFDLKKKDNLLVDDDEQPYLIDFGAAIIYKPGFHPFNHYLFRLGIRFDYNGWIKHKYMGRLNQISEKDRPFFNRTFPERLASVLKQRYRGLKKLVTG
jgi:serine/threonine protein kinase